MSLKNILSHVDQETDLLLKDEVEKTRKRILETGDIPEASVDEQLKILQQLTEFGMGRFMLVHKGLNGYWTRYFNLHNKLGAEKKVTNEIEKFWLERAPEPLASQQRYHIFQEILQMKLKNEFTVCSLPCGMMDDLLTLDLKDCPSIKLVGIDIDEHSIKHAKQNALEKGLLQNCTFQILDAWNMDLEDQFDILTSNGLNIYVKDDDKVVSMYKNFYKAIKTGGILVTSSISPPPEVDKESNYDMSRINISDYNYTNAIIHVINPNWLNFRSEKKTTEQLLKAGFKNIEIHYDHARIFPTYIASK